MSNENNQYADHIGIELLYCSELARRAASGGPAGTEEAALLESFVEIDLLPWLGRFTTALYEEGRPTTVCWPISPRVCLALCGPSRRAHQPVQPKEERFLAERLCLRAL